MDIFEFELRYKSYEGMVFRYNLDRDQELILKLVQKTDGGALDQALVDTSVEDLHEKTIQTYTQFKKDFISSSTDLIGAVAKPVSEYLERLEYELKVVHEMGYNTYFLIVEDYISWAKDNDIVVGPGRGSCAGSIISYLTGITDIDPLEYDLIFERFLNPARISMPDIDTDFEDTQRQRVIEYIVEKYGQDKVAHIGTYMSMGAKAAFKDVARSMGMRFDDANKITSLITEKNITKSLEENEDFSKLYKSDEKVKKIVDMAKRMEGTMRQTGVHACGMIIAPEHTSTYSAIQHPPKSGSKVKDETRVVSQYDGGTIEDIGLLKMDLLGLRNLSIIKNTMKILAKRAEISGKALDPIYQEFLDTMLFHPPLDDEAVYKNIFWKGDTGGVFQFESDGMKQWLKKLKASEFDDLIAMVSLYRPGPMDFIPNYVDRKHGVEKVSYMQSELKTLLTQKYSAEVAEEERKKLNEDLSPLMDKTYGIAVYQEQLMRLVQSMAGFSMAEADKLRKGVGKKIASVIEALKKKFVEKGIVHRDYKPETTTWIYEKMIEPAARYSFNKSHAACYAYISYQTAYLKHHHPIAFHAALLRSVQEETNKLAIFIDEIKMQGYDIRLPDINESFKHVAAVQQTIRLGFLSIKGIGSEVARTIEEERKNGGRYDSLSDFCKRCKDIINKKTLESLINAGALDAYASRKTLWTNIPTIIDWVKTLEVGGQAGGLFAAVEVQGADLELKDLGEYKLLELLKMEYAVFKSFVSLHPLDGLYSYIRGKRGMVTMFKDKEDYGEFSCLGYIKSIQKNRRGGGYFVAIEDTTGFFETYVNDMGDLKVFDLVGVKGYYGRRPRLDQLSIFTIEGLREKAELGGSWKPDQTVASVRLERHMAGIDTKTSKSKKKQKSPKVDTPAPSLELPEVDVIGTPDTDDISDQSSSKKTVYILPEDINVIMKIAPIVQNHGGDIALSIGKMNVKVSEDGWEKLDDLLK